MPSDDEGLTLQPSVAVPSAAWSRNFWAKPPRRKKPLKPTLMQTIPLMPLGLRMWRRVRAEKSATGEAFMDPFNDWQHDTSHGVPVGGIGCGAMGRGWRGEFRRYSTGRVPAGLVFVTDDTPHTGFSVCASTDTVPSEGCMLLPAPATPAKEVKYVYDKRITTAHLTSCAHATQVPDSGSPRGVAPALSTVLAGLRLSHRGTVLRKKKRKLIGRNDID